jgi:hypothetical protein
VQLSRNGPLPVALLALAVPVGLGIKVKLVVGDMIDAEELLAKGVGANCDCEDDVLVA